MAHFFLKVQAPWLQKLHCLNVRRPLQTGAPTNAENVVNALADQVKLKKDTNECTFMRIIVKTLFNVLFKYK